MATRVNRAATSGNKKGGKSNRRNRTVASYKTNQKLDSPRNQRVFEVHGKETVARRRNETAGERPGRAGFGSLYDQFHPERTFGRKTVPRVSDPSQFEQPKFKKKGAPSGRGISGGRIYVSAAGDRPKPKKSGWSRS